MKQFIRIIINVTLLFNTQITATRNVPDAGKRNNFPKLILYWNTFFNHSDFLFGFGQEPFINARCKINNCVATNDRNLFNRSDGIIFHAGNYEGNDLPGYRFPHQRFIFLNLETLPDSFKLPCFSRPHFYNWTMSHRRDSDVHLGIPYGAR